jgi:small subunit ribosomal protein S10
MRLKFKSYDLRMLDATVAKVMWVLLKSWAKIKWPIPLPKKRKMYTVLKAPFVYKDAREQFERITYSRLIDIESLWEKTIEYLNNVQIPVGIMVDFPN